ncbi:hypothetical protein WA1_24290 [Scytonema hofmannii PCC 7110]|uniref:Catalase n=1 Tax=Scytonema hofmannii PCC 7110 TaxID=128403 RepID=A0A139X7S8_9CYAN|nr:catalase family protein [Scytonema hofmannii]KYC40759.1 hypothetical protein WA1_24290 [Scytonema hofmannii PCC 7110]
MNIPKIINTLIEAFIKFTRRLNPKLRDGFDWLFQKPIEAITQFFINLGRKKENLNIAEEKILPNEEEIQNQIAKQMTDFLVKHYTGKTAERAGNTKTYGIVKGSFEILRDLPNELRQGIFNESRIYPAWIRFAGPGPFVTHDLDDNGILSIGVKLMGVEGEKLIDDEKMTQDFTGISAPTFTTPNIVENLKLQQQVYNDTPAWYFLNPFDSHLLDAMMQGLYAKAHTSPLEVTYFSCVPYLYGEGKAIKYSIKPCIGETTEIPKNPSYDYLREAMVKVLDKREVCFDFMVQLQTDPYKMPIENTSVIWSEKLSPWIKVATIHIPSQKFDSPDQLKFARNLSFNPWHSIAAHRPLGNQNRARKYIYLATSKFRQQMNQDQRIEPNGDEVFNESVQEVL